MKKEDKKENREAKPKKDAPRSGASELELRIKELTEALQRERADAQNIARRTAEEKIKLSGYFKAEVIKELLPTLDAANKALELAEEKDLSKEEEGMVAVLTKLKGSLEKLGLEKIEAEGKRFDENLHEAISVEESDGEKNIVTREMQAGYRLGDEILRHSMVVVRR
jgi:molecular chaperone GrpE